MNNAAESSTAGRHNSGTPAADGGPELLSSVIVEESRAVGEQRAKDRRRDAKRKRIAFLDHLLRELDSLVFVQLLALYYLDCSFFWFLIRSIIHVTTLTPLPNLQIAHQNDEHKAYMAFVLFPFFANFLLHLICKAPAAGEESRGYLHGGLMIDFIGQEGPTGKWKLAALDWCILLLQLVMVSVTVKTRELKKKLANISGGTENAAPDSAQGVPAVDGAAATPATPQPAADREQDVDAEERGLLRRTDTMSDTGADQDFDEEEALLNASASESAPADALELLSSGQCVIGDFSLLDTIWQEHKDYTVYRRTRPEPEPNAGLSPATLRRLHHIRATFGVGGG